MAQHNANNERVKRHYFIFLKEASRYSDATVDQVAQALARFEDYTKFRDFRSFNTDAAVAFKHWLADQTNRATGAKLSKATLASVLGHLRKFFHWLAGRPGYRSRLKYTDGEYFNLTEKDLRVASARRDRAFPTLEQVKHIIASMPAVSEVERRNRALVAFTLLTGARDSATASMKLKHVSLAESCVFQDARDVKTKFSKSFVTYFFPVGEDVERIVVDWVNYLRNDLQSGGEAPLFPATATVVGPGGKLQADGLSRRHWKTTGPVRAVFREASRIAGLPYFNPHSLRRTLVQFGQLTCRTPEDFKGWSQNLGHEEVMTTFTSYGAVGSRRQGEIIRGLTSRPQTGPLSANAKELALELVRALQEAGHATARLPGGPT